MDLTRPLAIVTPTVDGDVLAVLALADAEFTGRKVHQVAGRHSEKGVRNALHRLVDQGIVTSERIGAADVYRLNRRHLAAPYIVSLALLRHEFLERLRGQLGSWAKPPVFAVLFGSAARGDMTPASDIDLLIVRPGGVGAEDDTWYEQLSALSSDVYAWTGNQLGPLELDEEGVRRAVRADEPLLRDVEDHGIVLHGDPGYIRDVRRRKTR